MRKGQGYVKEKGRIGKVKVIWNEEISNSGMKETTKRKKVREYRGNEIRIKERGMKK